MSNCWYNRSGDPTLRLIVRATIVVTSAPTMLAVIAAEILGASCRNDPPHHFKLHIEYTWNRSMTDHPKDDKVAAKITHHSYPGLQARTTSREKTARLQMNWQAKDAFSMLSIDDMALLLEFVARLFVRGPLHGRMNGKSVRYAAFAPNMVQKTGKVMCRAKTPAHMS